MRNDSNAVIGLRVFSILCPSAGHLINILTTTSTETRYITGKRQYTTYLYESDSFPKNLIAPATFLWKQELQSEIAMEVDELSKQGQLWVWIHPSAFESTKAMIQETIAKTNKADLVNVKDMENSLVMFDFTGPRSTALLKAVLQLSQSDAALPYQEAHKVYTTAPSFYEELSFRRIQLKDSY